MMKTWAIVVGINNYKDEALQSLRYAKRDAELIYDFLKNQAKFTEVCLFTEDSQKFNGYSTNPFRSFLRKFLQEQFKNNLFQKEDHLWFFFSGHGIRYEGGDYLFTEDSDPNDPVETAISLNWVTERLSRSGAGNIVLILDACRNEIGRKGGSGFGREMQEGVTTIFSCTGNESSWEIGDPICQGAFTHILLEIFSNQTIKSYLTIQQTETCLQKRVYELNQQYKKTRQTPHIQISQIGKAEQILLPHLLSKKLGSSGRSRKRKASSELGTKASLAPSIILDYFLKEDTGCIADWDAAPDVDPFYGRENELEQLRKWIVDDRSRLIFLYGMGGIGKTSLAVKSAQNLEKEFDVLVWRSLKHTPSLSEFLGGIEESISPGYISSPKISLEENINKFLNHLRERRCLIILDDLEAILTAESVAGHYQQEYSQYGELIKRIALEKDIQSCLMLVSGEKIADLVAIENQKVHSWQVEGSTEIAKQILSSQGLEENEGWDKVINNYAGHPLGLKIVITMIKDLYDGQVEDFVRGTQGTAYFVFHDFMDRQFARLSSSERELMYTLAVLQRPIGIAELYTDSWLNLPQSELIEVMTSLWGRSLLKRNQTNFSLQPMIWRHTVEQIINEVANEVINFMKSPDIDTLITLNTYPWQIEEEGDNRLLLLVHRYFKSKPLTKALPGMLKILEENYASQSNYAIKNLKALISLME